MMQIVDPKLQVMETVMLDRLNFAALAVAFSVTAAGIAAAAETAASTKPAVTVEISNFTFSPGTVTVAPGTTVTWVNHDDIPHLVAATDHGFRSKALDTDDSYSFTFTSAGSFDYFCSLHPHMTGTVVVAPGAG
jgi:plastocyanin